MWCALVAILDFAVGRGLQVVSKCPRYSKFLSSAT